MIRFTEDCLLGVEEIDEEHRYLFELLARVEYLLQNEYGGDLYEDIKELLRELENYADQHFAHEEAYMKKIRDPELILQRTQHMAFREAITEFLVKNIDEDAEQREALEELLSFLAKWLYRHILGSDTMIGKLPPLEEWMVKDNPCEFSDEYLIGIDLIDREHRKLFALVDRANHIVRGWSEGNSYDEITDILKELKEYTEIHFADEESYMHSINYEGYEAQKRAHDAFISRLEELDLKKIEENPKEYMGSLIEFLLGWLINHILQVDKKIPVKE